MSSDYDRDDDRPRRDSDNRPKKKGGGMVVLLVILGAVLLLCVLPCGGMIWFGLDAMSKLNATGDAVLTKVGAGDYAGAYDSMTPGYKARRSLEQFTADMKAAKLDKYQAKSFKSTTMSSVNTRYTLPGTATLTDGTSIPVTIVIEQTPGGMTFTVDDITVSGSSTTTTPSTKPGGGGTPTTTK